MLDDQELKGSGLAEPWMVRLKLLSLVERMLLSGLGTLANTDRSGVAECQV